MTCDFSEIKKGLEAFKKISLDAVGRGLFKAGNELLHDAIYKLPYAPFDKGALRGAARTSGETGIFPMQGVPPGNFKPHKSGDELFILSGFMIIYAARWHELTPAQDARIHWTLPGSGRKYLEIKLLVNKKKYLWIVAESMKNEIGGRA